MSVKTYSKVLKGAPCSLRDEARDERRLSDDHVFLLDDRDVVSVCIDGDHFSGVSASKSMFHCVMVC